jgi:hypothetical protein
MRKPMLAVAALVLGASGAAAEDGFWCYRDFNGAPFSNCIFSTAQQCFAAVRIMGGVCERNHRPIAKAKTASSTGKRAGRIDSTPQSR